MSKNLIGFLGDSFVGKSHIVHSLTQSNVPYTAYVTIGCKISNYIYNKKSYSLYDIYPHFSFFKNAVSWIKKFNLIVFVCDASNLGSINLISEFYKELKPKNYVIFINKIDLIDNNKNGILKRLKTSLKLFRYSFCFALKLMN